MARAQHDEAIHNAGDYIRLLFEGIKFPARALEFQDIVVHFLGNAFQAIRPMTVVALNRRTHKLLANNACQEFLHALEEQAVLLQ